MSSQPRPRKPAPIDRPVARFRAARRSRGIDVGDTLTTVVLGALIAQWAMAWVPWSAFVAILSGGREYASFGLTFVVRLDYSLVILLFSLWIARRMLARLGALDREGRVTTPLFLATTALVLWQALYYVGPMYIATPNVAIVDLLGTVVLEMSFVMATIIALRYAVADPGRREALTQPWQPTTSLAASPSLARPRAPFRTTVAVALGLYPFLRTPFDILGLMSWLPLLRSAMALASSYLAAVLFLRTFMAAGIVVTAPSLRPAKIAFALFLVYAVVAPAAALQSAIPYGGGQVPPAVNLVLSAAQAFGAITLFRLMQRRDA